jgi:hypothetical protein
MRKSPIKIALLFATMSLLVAPLTGKCFYNPATGKWLSRDPIEEPGAVNIYAAMRNDTINNIDGLGLATLQWQRNQCEGCNGPPGVTWKSNTCQGNPAGKWVTGAAASFTTSCSATLGGDMCDTETHALIRAGRGLFNCCKKWNVTCEFKYDGHASGDIQAFILLRANFLGTPYKFMAGRAGRGGSANLSWAKTLTGTATVTYWGWTPIASMVAETRADGTSAFINTINESGSVSCSATCAKKGSK